MPSPKVISYIIGLSPPPLLQWATSDYRYIWLADGFGYKGSISSRETQSTSSFGEDHPYHVSCGVLGTVLFTYKPDNTGLIRIIVKIIDILHLKQFKIRQSWKYQIRINPREQTDPYHF